MGVDLSVLWVWICQCCGSESVSVVAVLWCGSVSVVAVNLSVLWQCCGCGSVSVVAVNLSVLWQCCGCESVSVVALSLSTVSDALRGLH